MMGGVDTVMDMLLGGTISNDELSAASFHDSAKESVYSATAVALLLEVSARECQLCFAVIEHWFPSWDVDLKAYREQVNSNPLHSPGPVDSKLN